MTDEHVWMLNTGLALATAGVIWLRMLGWKRAALKADAQFFRLKFLHERHERLSRQAIQGLTKQLGRENPFFAGIQRKPDGP